MRVLIVNTSEKTGGAAVAANRLMEALNNNGVKAKLLVRDKVTDDITVVGLKQTLWRQLPFLWERFVVFLPEGCAYGTDGKIVFADCAVTPVPTAEQLAEIAVCTADTARDIAKIDPAVAILSFSTKGSAKHEVVDKVIEATRIAQEKRPDLLLDGELQADAAIVPSVGSSKAPGSKVAGRANTLVFPSLEVGNIAYKLVQRLAGAEAVGPVLQGLAKPCNDLSRGCSIDDVYKLVAITCNQAIAQKNNK